MLLESLFPGGSEAKRSPDALVQSPQFGHQLRGPFVLVAAQVVNRLYGLGGGLQLVFVDVDALVLGLNRNSWMKAPLRLRLRWRSVPPSLQPSTFFHVSTTLAA